MIPKNVRQHERPLLAELLRAIKETFGPSGEWVARRFAPALGAMPPHLSVSNSG